MTTTFGHFNVIRYDNRPFTCVQEMNDALIKNWNSVVGDEDEVYYLGDFCMNPKYLWIVNQLKGIKYLIPGNHDVCYRSEKKVQKYLDAGFAKVMSRIESINIGDMDVLLSHLYYDVQDPRYVAAAPKDTGITLLHGHRHSKPEDILRKTAKGTIQIDVGVRGHSYTPRSEDEIKEIIW